MTSYKNKWNKWWKGEGLDEYIVSDGTYLYGENVDGMYSGYGITLGPKTTTLLSFATDEVVVGVLSYGNNILIIATNSPTQGRLIGYDIISNTIINEYVYVKSGGGVGGDKAPVDIKRIDATLFIVTDDRGAGGLDTCPVSYLVTPSFSFTPDEILPNTFSTYDAYQIVSDKDNVYIALGRTLYSIPSGNPTEYTPFSIVNNRIEGISVRDSNVQIYERDGNVVFWDGVSDTGNGSINYGIDFGAVVPSGPKTYIIGKNGNLYIQNGYSLDRRVNGQPKRADDINQITHKWTYGVPGASTYFGEGVFLTANGDRAAIYKIGELIPGIGEGLFNYITTVDGEYVDEFRCLDYNSETNTLYFAYKETSSGLYKIGQAEKNGERNDEGFIVTPILDGNNAEWKTIREKLITLRDIGGASIYYRTGEQDSWTLIYDIEEDVTQQKIGADEIDADKFLDVQFKISFKKHSTKTSFPYLRTVMTLFDKNEE